MFFGFVIHIHIGYVTVAYRSSLLTSIVHARGNPVYGFDLLTTPWYWSLHTLITIILISVYNVYPVDKDFTNWIHHHLLHECTPGVRGHLFTWSHSSFIYNYIIVVLGHWNADIWLEVDLVHSVTEMLTCDPRLISALGHWNADMWPDVNW